MTTALDQHDILIFDGACGTSLQEMEIPDSAWDGQEGCNELLNVTAPELIVTMHEQFLDAGAMIVETNTFGATRIVLAEYGLEDDVEKINQAGVHNARKAVGNRDHCYVCGSLGPGTKLPSLGHISPTDLSIAYAEQCRALVEAGIDLMIIETCQDLLQVKLALVATFETLEALGKDIPVLVSVTVERQGTMLVGTEISAAAATIEPFPVYSLGLNCATGPSDMESHIRYLSHNWPRRVSCIPNQGLPEVLDGRTHYPLEPQPYAKQLKHFIEDFGVSIVGGCCGTTPAHIAALAKCLKGVKPGERKLYT